jgi:hypothetical protein
MSLLNRDQHARSAAGWNMNQLENTQNRINQQLAGNNLLGLQSAGEEVDPLDWDPNDPLKKRMRKPSRRFSFEHPNATNQSGRKSSAHKFKGGAGIVQNFNANRVLN